MIEAIVALKDLIKDWGSYRRAKKREHFEQWIEPTYKNACAVFTDLLRCLQQLRRSVEAGGEPGEALRLIEDRRPELLTLRNELRAYLSTARHERNFGRFDEGIRVLLEGVLGAADQAPDSVIDARRDAFAVGASDQPIRLRGHSLLDVASRLSKHPGLFDRDEVIMAIDQQVAALEHASQLIATGYLGLKSQIHSRS